MGARNDAADSVIFGDGRPGKQRRYPGGSNTLQAGFAVKEEGMGKIY